MKKFSVRLKNLREEHKFSQRKMAGFLGIRQSAYFKYESGAAEPTQENLIKLAEVFDVTVDYLIGRENFEI